MATYTKRDLWNKISNGKDSFRGQSYDQWLSSGMHDEYAQHSYYDDDYLSEIEQYKDKPWYQQLLSNPWLAGNQAQFSPNFWQGVGEGLGNFGARDAYNANLQSNRSQWLAEFVEKMRQQDYNEPLQQVQRDVAAGINPDLAGNISSGSAAENDQPMQDLQMHPPGSEDMTKLFNVGTAMLGTVFSVVSNLQGLKSVNIDNKLKSLELGRNFTDISKGFITDSITEYFNGLDNSDSIEKVVSDGSYLDGLTHIMSRKVSDLPLSHKDKKRLYSIIDNLIYSKDVDSKSYSTWFEKTVNDSVSALRQSRNNRVRVSAEPGALVSDSKALDFLSTEVYKPIIDAQNELLLIQSKYNKDYFGTPGLGTARGLSDKAQYQMNKEMLDVKKRLTDAFKKINEKITGSRDLPPVWKLALQAGVASAEAFSISKLGFQK